MSKFTPETPVIELHASCLDVVPEYIDWDGKFIEGEATCCVAEVCPECGGTCVMGDVGVNSHRDWLRWNSQEDEDTDVPRDAYDLAFVVGVHVQPFWEFNYRVDELGEAVPFEVSENLVEDFPEITDQPGEVVEIDGDDVYVVFDGVEPRFRFDRDAWGNLEIVEDEAYDKLKVVDPRDCREILYNDCPMMNYRYEVDLYHVGGVEAAARAISHLPLCIVEMDNSTFFALTGGGMDFSWEICEAYMRVGQLPPVHFADLPGYNSSLNQTHEWVIQGCLRSLEVQADRLGFIRSRLQAVRERMSSVT